MEGGGGGGGKAGKSWKIGVVWTQLLGHFLWKVRRRGKGGEDWMGWLTERWMRVLARL